MFPPGYYQTNYRALRFREIVRMVGPKKAFTNYLVTRFKRPGNGIWMPALWSSIECRQEDLSEHIWQGTRPHRADFEKLGFSVCRYSKITRNLNPNLRDTGGIIYLDSSRRFIAHLIYHRLYVPANGDIQNIIVIVFTAVFEPGCLSYSNNKSHFDPLDRDEVIHLNSFNVAFIYEQFVSHVRRRSDQPREFPTLDSLRCWFNDRQVSRFKERVSRQLFVPMTEKQVEAAMLRVGGPPSPTKTPPVAIRTPIFWLLLIATVVLLSFLHVPLRERSDSVTYRGQQFKMARVYASYEDYKDDPNNLNTNELGRIEQAMTSAKVPTVFKNRKEFLHVLIFDLSFPGYGFGGLGESPKTEDGSILDVETVEIPQRDKSRYLVVRESSGHYDLIDDFVAGTATNAIAHVKSEARTLRYYDEHGGLVREQRF
jgi:hypothetical protein